MPTWREFVFSGFWVDFGSRPLDSTCCIRLIASFDTFQQRTTMAGDVGCVWPGLYGLMKRYWKYSHTETPV